MYICHHIQLWKPPPPSPHDSLPDSNPSGCARGGHTSGGILPTSQRDTPGALEWLHTDTLPHRSERRPYWQLVPTTLHYSTWEPLPPSHAFGSQKWSSRHPRHSSSSIQCYQCHMRCSTTSETFLSCIPQASSYLPQWFPTHKAPPPAQG